jgi:hypothetical protein
MKPQGCSPRPHSWQLAFIGTAENGGNGVDEITPKAETRRAVVSTKGSSTPSGKEGLERSSDELLAELRPLIGRAQAGDEEASFAIRNILEEEPNLAHTIVEVATRKTERVLLDKTSDGDVLLREALSLRLEATGSSSSLVGA